MSNKLRRDQVLARFFGSKITVRMAGVSQFLPATLSLVNTRFTHSVQVMQLSLVASRNIKLVTGFDINKTNGAEIVCIAHDNGHPPFAHIGAEAMDERFKAYGLEEGFDDNSQIFNVLERHGLIELMSDAEISGITKYRNKLYAEQEDKYGHIIDRAIAKDTKRLKKAGFKPKDGRRHSLTNLMDICDEIAYTTADAADAICVGIVNGSIIDTFDNKFADINIIKSLAGIKEAIRIDSKTQIRDMFASLAVEMAMNLTLNKNGEIVFANKEYKRLRKKLFEVVVEPCFDKEVLTVPRAGDVEMLNQYITAVVEEGYMPSKTYGTIIENAETKEEKLRAMRDMIAETPEQTIREFCQARA